MEQVCSIAGRGDCGCINGPLLFDKVNIKNYNIN